MTIFIYLMKLFSTAKTVFKEKGSRTIVVIEKDIQAVFLYSFFFSNAYIEELVSSIAIYTYTRLYASGRCRVIYRLHNLDYYMLAAHGRNLNFSRRMCISLYTNEAHR